MSRDQVVQLLRSLDWNWLDFDTRLPAAEYRAEASFYFADTIYTAVDSYMESMVQYVA